VVPPAARENGQIQIGNQAVLGQRREELAKKASFIASQRAIRIATPDGKAGTDLSESRTRRVLSVDASSTTIIRSEET
jgi:hypothetical protein